MSILVPVDLRCPSCGDALPADDVNVARGVAVCRACDVVYSLGDGHSPVGELEPEVPVPASLTVDDGPERLVIRRKWNRAQGLALAFFFAFWDAFLVFWYSIALFADGGPKLLMTLFPLLHVAAGVGGTWTALANLFNTTRIEASRRVVRTSAGPIPYPGSSVTHDVGDTVQFFVDRTTKNFRMKGGNSPKETFRVCAFQRDGTVVPIMKSVDSLAEARAIERLLERRFGMRDVPLRGEEPRARQAAGPEVKPKAPEGGGGLAIATRTEGGEVGLADRETGAISLSPVGPRKTKQR